MSKIGSGFRARRVALLAAAALVAGIATGAQAQELVQTFKDPAFGGNPFNGDYLLAIANTGRPAAPTTPAPVTTTADLLAAQIQSQLTSSLSSTILSAIQNAKVGQSGSFTIGNDQISYARAANGTTVTFKNTTTGVVNTILIPPPGSTGTASTASTAVTAFGSAISAEQALAATGAGTLGQPPL